MRVKVVSRAGQSALIEYQDGGATVRGTLPAIALTRKAGTVYEASEYEADKPQLAAPYGLPWADLIKLDITPQAIEAALHQYGIYTAADIERNHTQALAAIQSVYARVLMELIHSARAYQSALENR